jgi:hypothetical protein
MCNPGDAVVAIVPVVVDDGDDAEATRGSCGELELRGCVRIHPPPDPVAPLASSISSLSYVRGIDDVGLGGIAVGDLDVVAVAACRAQISDA